MGQGKRGYVRQTFNQALSQSSFCDTGLPQYLLQQAYVDLSAAVRIGNVNVLPSLYHELMLSTRKWA